MPIFHNDVWYNNDGTPMYQGGGPTVLANSAMAIYLISGATAISTNGLISGMNAPLSPVPVGTVRVYVFAQTGLPAGLYYAKFSSGTNCQLYQDAETTLVLSGVTAGAYTGNPGSAVAPLLTIPLPANFLGNSGVLSIASNWEMKYDASTPRATAVSLAGTEIAANSNAGNSSYSFITTVQNAGNGKVQLVTTSPGYGAPYAGSTSGNGTSNTALDLTVASSLVLNAKSANNTYWMILKSYTVSYMAGA